jgi:sensor domain CHASE-containing protein
MSAILLSAIFVLMLVSVLVYQYLVFESYPEYQSNLDSKELSRVIQALDRETTHLDQFLREYSYWDDSFELIANPDQTYIQKNFGTLEENEIHLLAMFDSNVDPALISFTNYAENRPLNVDSLSLATILRSPALADKSNPVRSIDGLIMTEYGKMIIVARPVFRSYSPEPSNGYIVFGRSLDKRLMDKLRMQTTLEFEILVDTDPGAERDSDMLPLANSHTLLVDAPGIHTSTPFNLPSTVLVVEDEDPVRNMIEQTLVAKGYTVKSASTGEEALRLIFDEGLQVCLLILDCTLPSFSGPDIYRALKDSDINLPLVFISGYSEEQVGVSIDPAWQAEFINKPIVASTLFEAIGKQIQINS